jgi:hypothetical protein
MTVRRWIIARAPTGWSSTGWMSFSQVARREALQEKGNKKRNELLWLLYQSLSMVRNRR